MSKLNSKANFQWLLKMAWRDGKTSLSRLMLFMASIILGIAAVVSIQLFSDNLKQNIKKHEICLSGSGSSMFIKYTSDSEMRKILKIIPPAGCSSPVL